uniref:CCHC-type domain-containing protein n=1 Tax=Tanacetum cinerariifolium TaxID=118510 RepID=A0A699IZ46_TANCI|nr:hypothetical protein [Tanacetum cinerariifolium]
MSQDVIMVGSTMRISLLYRGEYSQWRERFMNYLEEKTDGEAMTNSIQNEKKTQKIDRLARYLWIQGLPNDVYSLIDSNKTAKDLWDALERQMRGFEYGEQDRKAVILYEYETFKATKGEQLLDTYLCYLQVINDWKKCGYKKDNCDVNDALGYKKKVVVVTSDPLALVAEKTKVSNRKEKVEVQTESEGSDDEDISDLKKITALLAKAFNRKKYYAKPTNNNFRTSLAFSSANKKPKYVKSVEKKEDKKADEKKRDVSKVKCYNCKKKRHFAKDCKKAKVKDYNYYKIKMLLAKKDSDEQVLLAEDEAWMESNSDSDQEINANMVFMAQIEKFLLESDESSSFTEETIDEVAYYTSESEKIFHDAIESTSENFIENHIDSHKDYDKSEVDHNDFEEKEHLVDRLIRKFNHKIAKCQKRIEKANQQSKDLENQNKDLQEKYVVLINLANTFEEQNNEFNEQIKVLNEKNVDLLAQTKVLQDQLKQTSSLKPYVPTVILEKIIIDLEDEVMSLLEKEKANLKTIESLKSKGFESSENAFFESKNQSENDCQVVEKECYQMENSKVIAPGMFKLIVSQSVSPISMLKTSCDSKNVENKTKRKRRRRKSSKQNDKQVNNDVSRANSDFVHFQI